MPNYCDFSMRVKGKKENVKTLVDWLSAQYNYEDNVKIHVYNLPDDVSPYSDFDEDVKIPCEHHIGYRVFEVYPFDYDVEICDDEPYMLEGNCAWSVYSCMFEGEYTYLDENKGNKESQAISIVDASEELGLQIEIFSEEPGMCFSEHYYIDNGNLICNEDSKYSELWVEYYDKESETFEEDAYNELSETLKAKVEEAIADGEDFIIDCEWIDDEGWIWEYL